VANVELSKGERLDQRVVSLLPSLSRSFAAELIRDGKVSVNDQIITKAGTKIRPYDNVVLDYSPEEFIIPDIELPILYEDDDCVVIIKPTGLLTHSKGAFNPEPSVATWLHNRIVDEELLKQDADLLNNRAGIVHRLDRATSGVMICAKTPAALKWLQRQFSQRRVKKTYVAVVSGQLPHQQAVIDMPIERNPKKPQTFRTGINGKPAVTEYKVLRMNDKLSLLELKPQTGRTHQLRVHMAKLGHPIVGDTLYGGSAAARLLLHAWELEITLPSHERKTFTAPLPPDFDAAMGAGV